MNLRPHNLTVAQAIEGFILHKTAQGLSQRTIGSYKDILEHWMAFVGGETQVPEITPQDLKITWSGKQPCIFPSARMERPIPSRLNQPVIST